MTNKVGVLIDRIVAGGVEKIAIQQTNALVTSGHNATLLVLSRRDNDPDAFREIIQNIPVEYLEDRLPAFMKFSFKVPFFTFFSLFHITYPLLLPFFIKQKEFRYIISHNSYTTFTALTLSLIKNIPY